MNTIPTIDLQERMVYIVHSRNLLVGVFNGRGFIGIRHKFDDEYLFEEFLNDPPGSGTARATDKLVPLPEGIEVREDLGTICWTCKQPVDFAYERGPTAQDRWGHAQSDHIVRPTSVHNKALFDFLKPLHEVESEADQRRIQQLRNPTGEQHG